MHRSKQELCLWLWAAYLVVTDKRGSHKGIISAVFRYQDATWLLWQYHDEYISD